MQKINLTFYAATAFDSEFERLYDAPDANKVVSLAYAAEHVTQLTTQLVQGCIDSDSSVENVISDINDCIATELADFEDTCYLNVYVGTIVARINGDYDLWFTPVEDSRGVEDQFNGEYMFVHLYVDAAGNVYYKVR